MANDCLTVNEVFYSIQGESTWAGRPCVFVRLTGCHLRCHYCDTPYAFYEGERLSVDHVLELVEAKQCHLVEVTGGEPLLQPNVHVLMQRLCDQGKTVLLETSGACDISLCDSRVIRIMDLKSPGSGHVQDNRWANLDLLNEHDEVKFIICDRNDYEWARDVVERHQLERRVKAVLMSAAEERVACEHVAGVDGLLMSDLAEWILADGLPVCLQTQLHKLVWGSQTRGV